MTSTSGASEWYGPLTIKYSRVTGDIIDASVTDGLLSYLSERQRRLDKRLREYLSSRLSLGGVQ
jgi:hypothetical protein